MNYNKKIFNKAILVFILLFCSFTQVIAQANTENSSDSSQSNTLSSKEIKNLSDKEIALHYKNRNMSDSALVYIIKAIQASNKLLPKEVAELNAIKADIDYTSGNLKSGLEAINKSIEIYNTNNFVLDDDYADYLFRRGSIYVILNNTREALKDLVAASKLAKRDDLIAEILSTLSDLYFQLGDEEGALEAATKLTQKPLVDNISPIYIAKSYNIAANVYRKNFNFNLSIEQEQKAVAIYKENNNALGAAFTLVNMSDNLNKSGKYSEALKILEEAIQENTEVNNQYIGAAILLNKAESLTQLKRYKEAYPLFDNSLKKFNELSIPSGAAEALLAKSKALFDNKKMNEAELNAQESLKLAKENNLIKLQEQSYLTLYKIYKQKQGTTQALIYHEKYAEVKDSISITEKQQSIDNLKIRFDIQRLENEISLKDKELVLSEEKEKSSTYFNLLLILGIVSLLLLTYRQYKLIQARKIAFQTEKELTKIKSLQLNNEINLKKQEVTDFALQINEQNVTLDKLGKKINGVLKITDSKTKIKLRSIIRDIQDTIEINQEKVALYSKIDEAKSDFYHNIKEKFPSLSQREIEIAANLRLNLGSKQIAKQFNITHQSVNNYRFKIRKKIGLEKTDNLIEFLKQL